MAWWNPSSRNGRNATVILAALTVLVLALSVPGSLQYAREQRGFYLFSRAFIEDIPKRLTGPGRFRFGLQPLVAILLGVRSGLADARAGLPPYLYGVFFHRAARRVSVTYGEASKATLLRKLSDPYVKAIRYASDRIGDSGIVCFVNNNSFVTEKTFDGMRKELEKDFDLIYVLDLGGNVRKNPKLSGTTHHVFGIQVGVSINLFVRKPKPKP